MTDDWDKRVLMSYCDEIFVEELLSTPNFKLSNYKEDSEYAIPQEN